MRTESAANLAARIRRKTSPRYIVRFFHVPEYGSGDEYAFTSDFASGTIQNPILDKYLMLEAIDGAYAQVFPEQGRATQGAIQVTLTDAANLVIYYMSAQTFHLADPMTDSDPGPGDDMVFSETVQNIPAAGVLEITTGGVIERVKYLGSGAPSTTLEVVERGAQGTVAAAHDIGDPAVNGEQIRPGQRCQIFAGYADVDEEDFMPFCKMEVVGRRLHEDGASFVIELADIQRALRREAFLTASTDTPILLEGPPVGAVLALLTSTGTGTNGAYDLWPESWGLGIPAAYVDDAAIVEAITLADPPDVRFDIRAPVTGKDWLEKEILQPLNCYPVVTQDGKYSIKRYGGFRAA